MLQDNKYIKNKNNKRVPSKIGSLLNIIIINTAKIFYFIKKNILYFI